MKKRVFTIIVLAIIGSSFLMAGTSMNLPGEPTYSGGGTFVERVDASQDMTIVCAEAPEIQFNPRLYIKTGSGYNDFAPANAYITNPTWDIRTPNIQPTFAINLLQGSINCCQLIDVDITAKAFCRVPCPESIQQPEYFPSDACIEINVEPEASGPAWDSDFVVGVNGNHIYGFDHSVWNSSTRTVSATAHRKLLGGQFIMPGQPKRLATFQVQYPAVPNAPAGLYESVVCINYTDGT